MSTSSISWIADPEDHPGIRQLGPKLNYHDEDALFTIGLLQDLNVSYKISPGHRETRGKGPAHVTRPHESYFDPKTPFLLSPSETASTSPSPGVHDDIWDSPLPTREHCRSSSTISITTPLTPPDYPIADENAFGRKASKLKSDEEELSKDLGRYQIEAPEDLDFKPQKLFRNLTAEFQAIKNANAVFPNMSFDLKPTFEFGVASKLQNRSHLRNPGAVKILHAVADGLEPHAPKREIPQVSTIHTSFLSSTLEHIIPATIQSRIKKQRMICVASLVKGPDQRCTSKCAGGNMNDFCRELPHYRIHNDTSRLLECVQSLIKTFMCRTHQNVAFSEKRWPMLKDLVVNSANKSTQELTELQTWLLRVTREQVSSETSTLDSNGCHGKSRGMFATPLNPAKKVLPAAEYDQGLDQALHGNLKAQYLDFMCYQPKWTKNKSVSESLLKIIAEPLKPTDLRPGFIYMFWDVGNFGKIKIGRTNDLGRRLKDWNRDCRREHAYLPAILRDELIKVPHVSRIERLIHIELKEHRREAYCSSCRKHHREWFEVMDTMVVDVFRKWQNWIMQSPYELDAQTQEWILRSDMMASVAEVCQPILYEEKMVPTPPPRTKQLRTNAKRHKGRRHMC